MAGVGRPHRAATRFLSAGELVTLASGGYGDPDLLDEIVLVPVGLRYRIGDISPIGRDYRAADRLHAQRLVNRRHNRRSGEDAAAEQQNRKGCAQHAVHYRMRVRLPRRLWKAHERSPIGTNIISISAKWWRLAVRTPTHRSAAWWWGRITKSAPRATTRFPAASGTMFRFGW